MIRVNPQTVKYSDNKRDKITVRRYENCIKKNSVNSRFLIKAQDSFGSFRANISSNKLTIFIDDILFINVVKIYLNCYKAFPGIFK